MPNVCVQAWKWQIRKRMWDYMEANDIACFPRPVHHRIPNFANAELAAQRLSQMPEFINAKTVKVRGNGARPPSENANYHLVKARYDAYWCRRKMKQT